MINIILITFFFFIHLCNATYYVYYKDNSGTQHTLTFSSYGCHDISSYSTATLLYSGPQFETYTGTSCNGQQLSSAVNLNVNVNNEYGYVSSSSWCHQVNSIYIF